MFDHVTIRAENLAASARFYLTVLDAIGIEPDRAEDQLIEWADFSITPADGARPATRNLHVAFVAPTREHVTEFWRAGVGGGYDEDGFPGERPQYTPSYYGAFLRDPNGNSVEAVHHADTRRGGHIDHLWIGVRDLGAADAFYATVARHTGLRAGRRWEHGVQFRGAWATFSLVADGRPPTEGLHIAFPAPDRQTVEDFRGSALAEGHREDDAPGRCPAYDGRSYAGCVLDPDGTSVESVHHGRGAAAI
jgi:catechol 2,3-dioxygenase-like lactoylglutathione lyase family enzyme